MKRAKSWSSGVAVAGLVLGWASAARADAKQECAAAYEQMQALSDAGKLTSAREKAVACSAAACSAYVVKECAHFLSDLDESLPTVVLTAHDPSGADVLAVRVWLDGRLLGDRLETRSIPIDPGEHVFRFEMTGADPVEQKLVIRQGQKNRNVDVAFKSNAAPVVVAPPPLAPLPLPPHPLPPSEAAGSKERGPSRRIAGGVLLGLGGAGLLTGVIAGSLVVAQHGSLATACGGGTCPASEQSSLDAYHAKSSASTAGFIAGGVLAAAGLVVLVTAPKSSPAPSASVAPFLGVASAGVRGWF